MAHEGDRGETSPPRRPSAGGGPSPLRVVGSGGGQAEAPRAPRGNLPAETSSFVGRERELSEVRALLAGTRLLTLTGPGGCGKTRLALRAAREAAGGFGGAWWVELASLSDPGLVEQAVAGALGVREAPGRSLLGACAERLGSGGALLVLDNCEHLVGACAALAEALLRACPDLKVLATSREALGVAGETVWPVPALSLPPPEEAADPGALARYEATRLFLERAAAAAPGFGLTERSAAEVSRVCRRLDGIPLAIELAAARTRVLSVGQIAERLEGALRLLTGGSRTASPRQRTLRATMDWSYGLLPEGERALFRRLAAFSGGFTLEAAEEVCSGEGVERGEVLDLLSRLVDKSLVVVDRRGGEPRYGLLETVRQYGRERLEESGEGAAVAHRHARCFLRLAEEAGRGMLGPRQTAWLGRLEREHANLRAALAWFREEGEAERGLGMAAALVRFWWYRGYYSEGRAWLEGFLELPGAREAGAVRARALHALGALIYRSADWAGGDAEVVRSRLEESLEIYRGLPGEEPRVAAVLRDLGRLSAQTGDRETARSFLEESLRLDRRSGDEHGLALSRSYLGLLYLLGGDLEAAREHLEAGLEALRRVGDPEEVRTCLWFLIMLACERGDAAAARAHAARMVEGASLLQYRYAAPLVLHAYARLAVEEGRPARALRLAGAADRLGRSIGTSVGPALRDFLRRGLEPAWAALGEERGRAAFEAGRALSLREAAAYAFEEGPRGEERGPAGAPLTPRELEVLRLVGEGMTDAQVAGRLFVSTRTVNAHLRSILRKLGVRSRAAAVRLAQERGLLG